MENVKEKDLKFYNITIATKEDYDMISFMRSTFKNSEGKIFIRVSGSTVKDSIIKDEGEFKLEDGEVVSGFRVIDEKKEEYRG